MPDEPVRSLPWPRGRALPASFFDRDARLLARELLGKVIRHRHGEQWLSARIIETEAYYLDEKGSHASLGYTEKRKALFQGGGHIYMYYARGGDSLNFSAQGPGNAVLIKSAYPWQDAHSGADALMQMQENNPDAQGRPRSTATLCAGQTLLCKALGLKVPDWDAHSGADALMQMQENNPDAQGRPRSTATLCAGQTLLCKALGLKVPDWDAQPFDE